MTSRLPPLVGLILQCFCLASLISAQQYGSFFTVIYLNGAPISSSQVSCSEIGQPSYCCASGQSCAWDNSGQLACCPQGTTCSGSVAAAQGQYTQQTQTVYHTVPQNDCGCEETSSTTTVNVLPVVSVTSTVTTSTSTPNIQTITTTTTPVAGAAVVTANNCPNGYSTITEANVGAPTRVVNCYVIIDSSAERLSGGVFQRRTLMLVGLSILGQLGARVF